jgi:hypothetical protein
MAFSRRQLFLRAGKNTLGTLADIAGSVLGLAEEPSVSVDDAGRALRRMRSGRLNAPGRHVAAKAVTAEAAAEADAENAADVEIVVGPSTKPFARISRGRTPRE